MEKVRLYSGNSARSFDESLADLVDVVVLLELVALLLRAVAADGRHVDHAHAELHERPALHGDVEVGDVAQREVHEAVDLLVRVLALEVL